MLSQDKFTTSETASGAKRLMNNAGIIIAVGNF